MKLIEYRGERIISETPKIPKKGANLMINHTDENNNPEIQCKFGITNTIKTQLINWFVSQPAFIKALFLETVWEV